MLKKQIAGSAPPSTPLTTTPQGRQSFKPTSFENSFFGRALNSSPHPPNYPAPSPVPALVCAAHLLLCLLLLLCKEGAHNALLKCARAQDTSVCARHCARRLFHPLVLHGARAGEAYQGLPRDKASRTLCSLCNVLHSDLPACV